ncbi:hypothetical protein [Novosphingobium sp. SG720]|uniref:hypothetical protein n=1 Tax=Novosphingobium sp. SG720 TaxID=2586998 RepID=UPI00144500E0|nr:hypothetical protein [Novosphingobium sp. SG720]NKJ42534.1 hypothetical protein [Novosphingobium sp. SG720]
MSQGKAVNIALVTLGIGFAGGFVLRPVIAPVELAVAVASPTPAALAPMGESEARGKPYFAAHLDEARDVMKRCANGSAHGDECFNADMAITEADGRARHKRFFGN